MSIMQTSERGILELCEHEGIVPAPYLDSVGVWTWGVGHTAAAGGPNPAQMAKAMPSGEDEMREALEACIKQLAVDLRHYEDDVNQAIRVPLKQHEFDALVSFHYNTGGIHRAKLTQAINAGRPDASQHFFGWLRPPEIKGRRTAEKELFETGDYDRNGDKIPVWGTNGEGKLTRPIRTVSGAWVLSVMGRAHPGPKPAQVPPEVVAAVEDAGKSATSSTTSWAAIITAMSGAWATVEAWLREADPVLILAGAIVVAMALYVFRERLRKVQLGKAAKEALGL